MGLFSRKQSSDERSSSITNIGTNPSPKGSTASLKLARSSTPHTNIITKPPQSPMSPTSSMTGRMSPRKVIVPDIPLPKAPDPNVDAAGYLRSIYAVRQRTRLIMAKARMNELNHFDVDMSKFEDTAQYVVSIIKVRTLSLNLRTYIRGVIANPDCSVISLQTTPPFHPTAAGNTLTWVENLA
jgi:Protein of unknown function (DUF1688)